MAPIKEGETVVYTTGDGAYSIKGFVMTSLQHMRDGKIVRKHACIDGVRSCVARKSGNERDPLHANNIAVGGASAGAEDDGDDAGLLAPFIV